MSAENVKVTIEPDSTEYYLELERIEKKIERITGKPVVRPPTPKAFNEAGRDDRADQEGIPRRQVRRKDGSDAR